MQTAAQSGNSERYPAIGMHPRAEPVKLRTISSIDCFSTRKMFDDGAESRPIKGGPDGYERTESSSQYQNMPEEGRNRLREGDDTREY